MKVALPVANEDVVVSQTPAQRSRREVLRNLYSGLLGLIVVFVAVWPAVHGYLVREYAVNPWRYFGLAMYCTPASSTVELLVPTARGLAALPSQFFQNEQSRQALADYKNRLRYYGILLGGPPLLIAEGVFAENPELNDLLIRTRVLRLEPNSGMLKPYLRCVFHYRRVNNRAALHDSDIKKGYVAGKK